MNERTESAVIRILLVDDHAVVREGIRAVLEDFDEVSVVGEANDGDSALVLLERLRPDLLMSDLKMPGLPAAELVKRALASQPQLRVLMFTSFAERTTLLEGARSSTQRSSKHLVGVDERAQRDVCDRRQV